MDSEHRHELQENALANWLTEAFDRVQPMLPAIGVGAVVAVAGVIGWNSYSSTQESTVAERWRSYTLAMEGSTPSLDALRDASNEHPGTPVADWADITWADGRMFFAADQFLRNRPLADTAIDESVAVYERLVDAKDAGIAARASYGVARAFDMRGEIDKAIEQYGRVTGSFGKLAAARAEELAAPRVKDDYAWLAQASAKAGPAGAATRPDLEPDDVATPAETEATLDDILSKVQTQPEEPAADATSGEAAADEGSAGGDPADTPAVETVAPETPAVETPAAEPAK
ncbi:MAG: hypothetical protein ACRCT8_10595 [Lacipirellulaceae bacterium]